MTYEQKLRMEINRLIVAEIKRKREQEQEQEQAQAQANG